MPDIVGGGGRSGPILGFLSILRISLILIAKVSSSPSVCMLNGSCDLIIKDPLRHYSYYPFTFILDTFRNKAIRWRFNASMATCLSAWRNFFRKKLSFSRKTTNISSLPLGTFMEETLSHYKADHYYPVKIGDIYGARYQVAGKVGYVKIFSTCP